MFNGGGVFAGGTRPLAMLGWILAFLAAASLGVAIANTVYTYINYNGVANTCTPGQIINLCPVIWVYISSGIWASIPIFFAGVIAIRLATSPNMTRLFQILVMLCVVLFAPAMVVISALEVVGSNITPVSPMNLFFTITSSTITGDVTKFALPVVVAVLGLLEFIILIILMCFGLRQGGGYVGGYYGGAVAAPVYGGYGGYGYGGGYGFGGDLVVDAPDYGDDDDDGGDILIDGGPSGGYGGSPQFIPIGGGSGGGGGGSGGSGGGAAGGGAAGGSAAASSGGGTSGGGGASNNNNNNIVVPPVIIPPAPAAAPQMPFMPFPFFMPQNNPAPAPAPPIIITTTTAPQAAPAPPPPQPVYLPIPRRRRPMPPPPPPMPYLRPLPPTRYYSGYERFGGGGGGGGFGGGFGGGSGSFDEAFLGKPFNRF